MPPAQTPLPAGYSFRRPTVADAEAVLAVAEAHETAAIGEPDITIDDVLDVMERHDPATDEWVVEHDGDIVAWGYVDDTFGGERARILVTVRPGHDATAGPLLDALVARAAELATASGAGGVDVRASAVHGDTALRDAFQAAGFAVERFYGRMHLDLSGDETAPEPPAGIEVKVFTELPDREEAARVHHRIMDRGLGGQRQYAAADFETWWANITAASSVPLDEWRVAYVDGEPAAVLQTSNVGIAENGGWIRNLVVHPSYRGRGLAQLLLGTAFALFASKGRTWVGLAVDTGDPARAYDIYEKVGMRPKYMIDVMKAHVPSV
ncbi:GNAT family N-acetyltransferase [Actinorhabdospora filicis]|nr:GNAT family N-acetyltransferase [Actinorhabdospora filicis]